MTPEMSPRRLPAWPGDVNAEGRFLSCECPPPPPLLLTSPLLLCDEDEDELVETGGLWDVTRGRKAPELPNGNLPSSAGWRNGFCCRWTSWAGSPPKESMGRRPKDDEDRVRFNESLPSDTCFNKNN